MAENYLSTPVEQYHETADPYPGMLTDVPQMDEWAAQLGAKLEAPAPAFNPALAEAHETDRRQRAVWEARLKSGVYVEGTPDGEAFPFLGSKDANFYLLSRTVAAGLFGLLAYSYLSGRPVIK